MPIHTDLTSTDDELWIPIIGSDGKYEVSSDGAVRAVSSGKIVKLTANDRGYLCCGVTKDGERKIRKVHIMVAEAFLGPRPEGHEVTFHDGSKLNCRLANLRYATAKEHAKTRLLKNPAPSAKLTATEVREMRALIDAGTRIADAAAQYGVAYGTVKKVKHRTTWSYLE